MHVKKRETVVGVGSGLSFLRRSSLRVQHLRYVCYEFNCQLFVFSIARFLKVQRLEASETLADSDLSYNFRNLKHFLGFDPGLEDV